MKKLLLFAAIAAVAMSGCSSDENAPSASKGKALSFGTFVEKSTKGSNALTGTTYPVGGSFMVLGYNTGTSKIATASPLSLNYMRSEVTCSGVNSYTYYPVKYWPDVTSNVSFFAIHPADDIVSTLTPTLNGTTLPAVVFTVNSAVSSQADLMTASVLDQTSASNAGTVSFNFTHKLTKIGFSAKLGADYNTNGDYVHITSIAVSGVNDQCTFTFSSYKNDSVAQSLTGISTTNPTGTFTLGATNMNNNGYVSSTTSAQVNGNNSYLLMVPATYGSESTAAITVKYNVESSDGTTVSHTIVKNLKDFGDKGTTWTAGTAINYNLTITLTGVVITSSLTDWPTSTDTGVN